MQLGETEPQEGTATVLGPSMAIELSWALHSAFKLPLPATQTILGPLYERRPELAERVRSFWDDELICFTELEVLASWARALEARDLATLIAELSAAIDTVPLDLALESESDRDRAVIIDRLSELRRLPARRRQWLELLADLWAELDEPWRARGVPVVERAGVEARERLARGAEWLTLVGYQCEAFQTHLPRILERHRAGRAVVVVPCAFFGKAMYVETPWCILVGIGTVGDDALARARTAEVARRLRAVADPTRLAILDFLADGSHSVGEIARSFSLAQPTVSSHVKHLREAGLVSADRRGARRGVAQPRRRRSAGRSARHPPRPVTGCAVRARSTPAGVARSRARSR